MGRVDMVRGTAWGNVTIRSPHRKPCPSDGGEHAAAGPEAFLRRGSPSELRLVSSGGAPTDRPQNVYFTYLTAYRSPTATRACTVPVLAVLTMSSETTWLAHWSCGGPRRHVSSDIWEAILWQNWNSRCDPSVCFVWGFVASDFPFPCLYINVQTLDSGTVGESALWSCYCRGVSRVMAAEANR